MVVGTIPQDFMSFSTYYTEMKEAHEPIVWVSYGSSKWLTDKF